MDIGMVVQGCCAQDAISPSETAGQIGGQEWAVNHEMEAVACVPIRRRPVV